MTNSLSLLGLENLGLEKHEGNFRFKTKQGNIRKDLFEDIQEKGG